MAWTFQCDRPDFHVRSIPDDVQFGVQRKRLQEGSDIFRDMFACCTSSTGEHPVMDLTERADELVVLLRLLHDPPKSLPPGPAPDKSGNAPPPDATRAIPFPVLRRALDLADKYALAAPIAGALHSHLGAHAALEPLKVYGYASALGLEDVAAQASRYLLHPPLASYSAEEMKALPSAAALQRLVVLHSVREQRLKRVLSEEPLFPHGYGMCAAHGVRSEVRWQERKRVLLPKVRAGTDVAAEMGDLIQEFEYCPTCFKACSAAVDMLAYKIRWVPKRVNEVDG